MCASDLSYPKFVDKWRWTTNPNIFVNSNTFKMSSDRFDFILEFKSKSGEGVQNGLKQMPGPSNKTLGIIQMVIHGLLDIFIGLVLF
jgi:hypothetical protein